MGFTTLLEVFRGLLKLSNTVARYFKDQQLMDAGENKAKAEMSHEQFKRVTKAHNAANNVKHDADSVRNDPDNRGRH